MGIPEHLTCPRNPYTVQEATVRTGHGITDWFKTVKEYIKAIYQHPAYLTYMQSTSYEMLVWRTHSWNKDCLEKYQKLRYADDTTLMAEREEELKSLLMKVKEESEKASLKLNIQKIKITASGPITSWQIDVETMEK